MAAPLSQSLALVGDLGGTNARFALAESDAGTLSVEHLRVLACSDYRTLEDAIRSYLAEENLPRSPHAVVLAVAGPVTAGEVRFTNNHWRGSESALRQLGFQAARLINDFEALAYAAPLLQPHDLLPLGAAQAGLQGSTIAVLGPGTGFGMSLLARDGSRALALATEGGHAAFAPTDALEEDLLKHFRSRFGHVTNELILSGPGLLNLYQALSQLQGEPAIAASAPEITRLARGGDPLAALTVARFCAILGSVAGDAALLYGARGGVYVTGGLADIFSPELQRGDFRARFEDKGNYRGYVTAIPSMLITRPHSALLGAAEVAFSLPRKP